MWISDGKFDESGTMGEYVHFLGPGGAWVDVPSGLGLEALAPGRRRQLQLDDSKSMRLQRDGGKFQA